FPVSFITIFHCEYQQTTSGDLDFPSASMVNVISDNTPPTINATAQNGKPGCPDGAGGETALCLTEPTALVSISGTAPDNFGIASFTCTDNGGSPFPCGPGPSQIPLNGDGVHTLVVTITDSSGASASKTLTYFVDTAAPSTPSPSSGTLSLDFGGNPEH